ncbi:TPA: hypothetical protein NID94_003995 [Pseudomonas aeruginosa]|nr:hypothetical protein [Pseudomonas aeruginosa]
MSWSANRAFNSYRTEIQVDSARVKPSGREQLDSRAERIVEARHVRRSNVIRARSARARPWQVICLEEDAARRAARIFLVLSGSAFDHRKVEYIAGCTILNSQSSP